MNVTELYLGSRRVSQNAEFQLSRNEKYYSTRSIDSCHGKWYFEGTHYSGNLYHLFGFEMNYGYIHFLYSNGGYA